MTEKSFGVVTRAIDPGKLGNLVKKNLITEVTDNTDKGLTYFKSGFSKRELKVKLGLVYDQDIVEYVAQDGGVIPASELTQNNIGKAGSISEEPKEEVLEIQEKTVSDGKEAELKNRELELNKKASELILKEKELKEKEAALVNKNTESNTEIQSSVMGDRIKQKFRLEVPEINGIEFEDIQNFANDIKTFKKLIGNDWSEEEIIFSALVKSKKTALKSSMTTDEETNIEKFIEFLFSNYGHSPQQMWKKLRNIKQNSGENVLQFFNRVVKLFFSCRRCEIPADISDEAHQQEIRNIFISGLNNIELRKQLNMNEVNIKFKDLGKTAQSYDNGLKSAEEITNALKVLNIETGIMRKRDYSSERGYSRREPSQDRGRYRSRDRGHYRSRSRGHERASSRGRDNRYYNGDYSRNRDRSRGRSYSRDRAYSRDRTYSRDRNDRREERRCFRCGQAGHIIRNCRASSRTVSQYKKRMERSQSRDRNRSYSRDRRDSRDREHRVRFNENNN